MGVHLNMGQTMNLIGKINGKEIDDDDELRAYIDGVLVGTNKAIIDNKQRLFFQTIYYQDEQNVQFKLFKADRQKEYSLDKSVVWSASKSVGQSKLSFITSIQKHTIERLNILMDYTKKQLAPHFLMHSMEREFRI